MIKIKDKVKGLQCGGLYHVKTDSGQAVLVHHKTKKSIPVSLEQLRKLDFECVEHEEYAM